MAKDPAVKAIATDLFKKLEANDGFPPAKGKVVYGVFVRNLLGEGSDHLMYIGSSKDLERRRRSINHPYRLLFDRMHGTGRIVFLKYFYSENYTNDEKVLIQAFNPLFNKNHITKWH